MFPFYYPVSYRGPVVVGTDSNVVVIGPESTIIYIKGYLLHYRTLGAFFRLEQPCAYLVGTECVVRTADSFSVRF